MKISLLHYYWISIFEKETSKSNMTFLNNSVNIRIALEHETNHWKYVAHSACK